MGALVILTYENWHNLNVKSVIPLITARRVHFYLKPSRNLFIYSEHFRLVLTAINVGTLIELYREQEFAV